jgi:RNA polymerase sigma factor (sigma-70 family)
VPTEDSLVELSRRIASGDPEAFAVFYRAWFDRSAGLVRRATGLDHAACLDVVQTVMIRLAVSMPTFPSDADGERWLRRVLVNAARDRLREEVRRRAREQKAMRLDRRSNAPQDGERSEELAMLARQLARLEWDAADLLRRRFSLGWTLERIARELGLKPGAVDGRLRRLFERLRREEPGDRSASENGGDQRP